MQRTTVGSILRSTQAYCIQLCDKETLDFGIVYHNERYASLPDINQFREVLIEDPKNIPNAYQEAEQWFQEHNLSCHRWAPADGKASDELTLYLSERGFTLRTFTAMALTKWPDLNRTNPVRVLPARAMREAYREILSSTSNIQETSLLNLVIQSGVDRLDDPQYDMFVAILDKKLAGMCALYQVGDIARVMNLNVINSFSDAAIDQALLAHVLSMARRLTIQNVSVLVDNENVAQRKWYENNGFIADGEIVEYHRTPSTPENFSS